MKKVLEKYKNSDFFEIKYMSVGMIVFFVMLLLVNFLITQVIFESNVFAEYDSQLSNTKDVVKTIKSKEKLYQSYMVGVNSALELTGVETCDSFVEYIENTNYVENFSELTAIGLHLANDNTNPQALEASLKCIYPQTEELEGYVGIDPFADDVNMLAGKESISSNDVVMTELFTLASGNEGFVMYLYHREFEGVWTAMVIRYKPYFEKVLQDFPYEFEVKGPSSIESVADFTVYDSSPRDKSGYHSLEESFDIFGKPFKVIMYFESTSYWLMYFVLFNFSMIFFVILRSYYKLYVDLKNKKLL